jgi:hypothetical protein
VRLSVLLDGVSHEVTPIAGDLVHFERQFGEPVSLAMSGEHPRLEHVLFLAWRGLVRTKQYEGTFDEFLEVADTPQEPDLIPPPLPPG